MFKKELADLLTGANSTVVDQMFSDGSVLQYPKHYPESFEFLTDLRTKGIESKCEKSFGGEGEVDTYYKIWSFTKENKTGCEKLYVKFNGYCTSYNGATYEEMFFVGPIEKTIIDYAYSQPIESCVSL